MIPPTGESADIDALGVQPDGKILAAGSVNVVDTPGDDPDQIFAVVRYNGNGSLDTTFDGDGVANPRFLPASGNGTTSTSVPTNIFARNDGKILVVGNASTCCVPFPKSQVALVRFNADGSFDTTFASGGKALISFPADFFSVGKASIQPDNKIVLAGITGNVHQISLAVARLTSDGALDLTFSGDGRTNFVSSLLDKTATTDALQPDGKIITGGSARGSNSSGDDFLLARFEASSCLANCFAASRRVADFDGDRKADVSLYRPSDRIWYVQNSRNSTISYTQFGLGGDKIAPADYDGDGKTDIAVFRPETGVWFVLKSTGGFYIVQYGTAEDIPQPADYNGDGRAEIAVYRPSIGVWFILNSDTNQSRIIQFGASEDKPVASDYNGDGKTELAVYRPSLGFWYISTSETDYNQYSTVKFGLSTDKPVQSDYDGDGRTDVAVWRPSSGEWYVLQSREGLLVKQFGLPTDLPAPADYDGDAKTDIAVYRPSEGKWYQLNTAVGITTVVFGLSGDKPAANAFVY